MKQLILALDVPVSANARLIRARGSRRLISSARYRAWHESAVDKIKERVRVCLSGPMRNAVAVTMHVHYPDRRRRDIDNSVKGFFDACTDAGVWLDDSQVTILTIVKSEPIKGGLLTANIEEIDE